MTWDDVVAMALSLPGSTTSTSYGTPSLKVGPKLLTRLRTEDTSLVLLDVPSDERDHLIEVEPATFHVTPHYRDHAIVLARLATLAPGAARSFLVRRWRNIAAKRAVRDFDDGTT